MTSRDYSTPNGVTTINHVYRKISGRSEPPANWSEERVFQLQRGYYQGTKTPKYFRKKASGDLIPHQPYTRFDLKAEYPHGVYRGTYRRTNSDPLSYSYEVNSTREVPGAAKTQKEAEERLRSLLKMSNIKEDVLLVEALANCQPELDAGTLLAEMSKTIRMVVGVRKRAADLIWQARKGGFQTAKAASQAWLEWRYGWRILGYDIKSVTEYLNYPIRDAIVEGRAGQSYTRYDEVTSPFSGYYVQHDSVGLLNKDLSVRANVNVKLRGKSSNAFVSIPTTVWEVTPFSFVADWFLGIGDAIAAMEVLLRAEAITCSVGYKYTEVGSLDLRDIRIGTGQWASAPFGVSGGSASVCTLLTRAPRSLPLIYPRWRVKLDPAKFADLGAILLTRIKTK